MIDKAQLIRDLGIEDRPDAEQSRIYEDFTYEVGAAITDGLSDEQVEEFTQIINANEAVISAWLASHVPDYRDDPSFKELQVGYEEDPEKVSPEKVFASIAWVRVNRLDFEQIVTRIKREFREQLEAARATG